MKISKDLNLVIERPQEDGTVLRVHSMPIPLSVYEDNALMIAEAMMRVYGARITFSAAPRVLAPEMRKVAAERARARGDDERMPNEYDALLAEIHRRTMVLVPRPDGYEPMLFDEAVKRDALDEDDVAEVDGAILFFSAAWRFHGKADRRGVVTGAAQLWSGSVTSSNSTEYQASLGTSTQAASSGASAQPSAPGNGALPMASVVGVETDQSGASRAVSLPS